MRPAAELVIVGAGAAGLMAGIQAARRRPGLDLLVVDSRERPGAKIRVSGGGRCNLSHVRVDKSDFQSGAPGQVAAVLKAFPVAETLDFFRSLGLPLHEAANGRIYPASECADDVLEALLGEARRLGLRWRKPFPVDRLSPRDGGYLLSSAADSLWAPRLILAAGGRSLPKSGSDGSGLRLAEQLGLVVAGPLVPGLAPLRLADGHPLRELAGVTAGVELRLGGLPGRWRGELLCTHFGLSGPVVLDVSRHVLHEQALGRDRPLRVDWLPGRPEDWVRRRLLSRADSPRVAGTLRDWLPARLATTLLALAGLPEHQTSSQLDRTSRERLLHVLKALELPIQGARSWHHAECTAGGVDLAELDSSSLECRRYPALHICGELCDVDGRLGGFNFQWAWSSGAVAGRAAAERCAAGKA